LGSIIWIDDRLSVDNQLYFAKPLLGASSTKNATPKKSLA